MTKAVLQGNSLRYENQDGQILVSATPNTRGKCEGAGRPPVADPATKLVTVKMTPRQHAKFLELGGSRWVKRFIDETMSASKKAQRKEP